MVRSFLHRNGFRFRLHVTSLPGKPDIVLSKYRTIVVIRGCFWRFHIICDKRKLPSTNKTGGRKKLRSNVLRDKKHLQAWAYEGWKVLVIWSCLLRHMTKHTIK